MFNVIVKYLDMRKLYDVGLPQLNNVNILQQILHFIFCQTFGSISDIHTQLHSIFLSAVCVVARKYNALYLFHILVPLYLK